MDNLSTDITSQIGALELGDHLESHGDGVLESAGEFAGPPTAQTKLQGGCTNMCTFRCIGDGVLEAVSHLSPTSAADGCPTRDYYSCR